MEARFDDEEGLAEVGVYGRTPGHADQRGVADHPPVGLHLPAVLKTENELLPVGADEHDEIGRLDKGRAGHT